jgi:hypothetical protein
MLMSDEERAHAIRLCTPCKKKFGDEQTLQLAMLSSVDPIRGVCGTYFKPDFKNRRPCESCSLRFGLRFPTDVCSMCLGVTELD